jgi:peptide/nickel transport system substrate-binding protein
MKRKLSWMLLIGVLLVSTVCLAQEAKYGGTFYLGGDEPSNLNPILNTDGSSSNVSSQIYETLVTYTPGLTGFDPCLAASWENTDELTWVFHLQEGVLWQDGTPFTAEDVKFTFETVLDPTSGAARQQNFSSIDTIDVIDDVTVQFNLTDPTPFFLDDLALIGHIISKAYTEEVGLDGTIRAPMGTGPFILDEWAPGEYVSLIANENYWRGRPYLDNYVVKVIPESAVRFAALLAGEIHTIYGSMADVATVEADPDLMVFLDPIVQFVQAGFNFQNETLQDIRVRQALFNALDREAIGDAIFYGYSYVPNSPMPRSQGMYFDQSVNDKYAELYKYDPAQARTLLADAGWTDTDADGIRDKDGEALQLTLLVPSGGIELEQISVIMKTQYAAVGIDLQIESLEFGTWLDKAFAGEFDIDVVQYGVGFTPALQEQYHHTQGAFNLQFYSNIVVDSLLETGKTTTDMERRQQFYNQYQDQWMMDPPLIQVAAWPAFSFFSSQVMGMSELPLGQMDWLYKVWLDE